MLPCTVNDSQRSLWNLVHPTQPELQRYPLPESPSPGMPNPFSSTSLPPPQGGEQDQLQSMFDSSIWHNRTQRLALDIHEEDIKEEKCDGRDDENNINLRSISMDRALANPAASFNFRNYRMRRKPDRRRTDPDRVTFRRGHPELRFRPSWVEKQKRIKLKQECINLYGSEAPLHFHIKMNNINKVKQLLRTNDPNKHHTNTGETPLHLACRLGLLDMVKLLRRHPSIKTDLLTTGGAHSVSPVGCTATSLVKDHPDILQFLKTFKPKDAKDAIPVSETQCNMWSEWQSVVQAIRVRNEGMKSEVNKIRPKFDALDQENRELKKKLEEMKMQDIKVMGTELPREKPTDTKKLAEVLTKIRKLDQDLTACQERLWIEKENEAKCSICVDRPKDTVLIPCGHFFCSTCVESVSECPNCQKPIERQLKTF